MLFKSKSIKGKLTGVAMLTSVTALLAACAAFITYEIVSFRRGLANNYTVRSEVIAATCTAAIAFRNPADAEEVLSALKADRDVTAAAIYDADGKLFAKYPTTAPTNAFPSTPESEGYWFDRSHFVRFQPVFQNEKRLGTLYLQASLRAMRERYRLYGVVVALVMAGSCLSAWALASRLQWQISRPVLALAESAEAVARSKDFSLRAKKMSDDELGLLTDAFNHMLAQIQEGEAALRESGERLRLALQSAGMGTWSWQIGANSILWDDYLPPLFGLRPGSFAGKYEDFVNLIHPDDRTRVAGELENAVKKGAKYDTEYQVVWPDRGIHWLASRGMVYRNPQGEPWRMTGACWDVSERKKAQEVLGRFAAMIESSDDAIISKTLDGTITSWNPGAERIFGHSSGEMMGKPVYLLIPNDRMNEESEVLSRIVQGEQVKHLETVRVRKDGTRIFVSASISPLRDAAGRIIGASEITRDITQRKQAEEQIRRMNEELEQRVTERTAQLEAANQELEAFSYSVSHDLRAPLRHIDGYVELLSAKAGPSLDEKNRRYLNIISDSARQMGQLIDDLLVFSRMGREELKQTTVDLKALAEASIRELAPETKQRNIVWRIGQLPQVRGDESMLQQVFVNLIGNAVKYSRPRDPAEIEIGYASAAAEEIVFFVRDNGVGFDMEYADKLFGVFQRLHAADEFEGTGIGLANVRRIIARHGGRTWAEGRVNGGATFYFSLPKPKKG